MKLNPSLQVTHCDCRLRQIKTSTEIIKRMKSLSFDEVRKNYFVSCTSFSPSEKILIPVALAYEMLRSVHMPPDKPGFRRSVPGEGVFHRDWAMVDSQFYIYFLVYVLYWTTRTPNSMAFIKDMERSLEWGLIHTETAMNLIGWCYKQEGDLEKAIEYFYDSLSLQLIDNAAFWHLLFTLCELISRMDKIKSNRVNKNLTPRRLMLDS